MQSSLLVRHSDPDFIIVEKPPMLHTIARGKSENSLSTLIQSYLGDDIDSQVPECGLVQRLDFETSGLVLVALKLASHKKLYQMLLEGNIKKSYLALVCGQLKQPCQIENFLGSRYRRSKKVSISETAKARYLKASSSISPLKYDQDLDCTLVKIEASPARRHQVRAHCAHLGYPLYGDLLYASEALPHSFAKAPRFYLHANSIKFDWGDSGDPIRVTSPLPQDWPLFPS